MQKRASLKDIANKVGVSIALVSYVLNGKEKEARVGEKVAAKIRKVAAEFNYQPNLIARGLKSGKTRTIGLIVADISNPFFSGLARIIENEAHKHGYTVIFGSSDEDVNKLDDLLNIFLNRQVDGLIIVPVEHSEAQMKELKKKNVPFVFVDRNFPGFAANQVMIDNYDAAYKATRLLQKNGYRNIGLIAFDNALSHMEGRISGYTTAISKESGKKTGLVRKVSYQHFEEDVEKAVSSLLDRKRSPVDAILFANNSIALAALKILMARGIRVPDELGIVCFDESDSYNFFYSSITYVNQNLKMMGENAVNLVIDVIETNPSRVEKIVVPSQVVVGESSGLSGRKQPGASISP